MTFHRYLKKTYIVMMQNYLILFTDHISAVNASVYQFVLII